MKNFIFALCILLSYAHAQEKAWGSHLSLDCQGCSVDKISCSCNLSTFVKVLIDDLGMERFGEPAVEYFESSGFSLVALAESGSVTGHFVEKTGEAFIDIVCRKQLDSQVALQDVKDFLEPKNIQTRSFVRQAQ